MNVSSLAAAPRGLSRAGGWLLSRLGDDPWLAVLIALAVADYAVLAPHLLYPGLPFDYPFHGGDTFDWFQNALALLGEPVRNTVRPPALPLALALLSRLGWLPVFPFLGLAFHHAAAVGAHVALRRRFGRSPAFVAGLLVLFGASVSFLALQVMADLPAAILLGAACAVFLAAGRDPRLYPPAGLLAGLSAITQQAALLLPLPVAITVLLYRRDDVRKLRFWVGCGAFALLPCAWFVAKWSFAGTFLDVGLSQWRLLGVQPENVPQFLLFALSSWGWPYLLLALAGAALALRDLDRGRGGSEDRVWALFPLLTTGVLLLFFGLFYDFLAKRFLIYAFFPSLALVAGALAALRARGGRRAFVPVAVLAVALAAWPLQNPALPNLAALWPFPATYSIVPPGDALRHPLPRFDRARIEVVDPARTARWSLWARVFRADRHRGRSNARDLQVPEDVATAIFVEYSGADREGAWATLTRLGSLVRRRVAFVPPSLYPRRWWGWRRLEPMGVWDHYRLFRLSLPRLPAAVLAFDRRDRRGRALARRLGRRRGLARRPSRRQARAAAELARRAAARFEETRAVAVVLPAARGEWMRFFPIIRSGRIELPDAGEADQYRSLAAGLHAETTTVGGLEISHVVEGRFPLYVIDRAESAARSRARAPSGLVEGQVGGERADEGQQPPEQDGEAGRLAQDEGSGAEDHPDADLAPRPGRDAGPHGAQAGQGAEAGDQDEQQGDAVGRAGELADPVRATGDAATGHLGGGRPTEGGEQEEDSEQVKDLVGG